MSTKNVLTEKGIAYHGIEGAKYALRGATQNKNIKNILYSKAISINSLFSKQDIYGDNMILGSVPSDKGYEGTFGMTAQDRQFEEDIGVLMKLDKGLATPTLSMYKRVDLYYEFKELLESGIQYTVKVWLLNVEVGKPSAINQATNTENITIGEYTLPIKVMGDYIMTGNKEDDYYRDEYGNRCKAFLIRSLPGMEGYDEFEKTVPTPLKAIVGAPENP